MLVMGFESRLSDHRLTTLHQAIDAQSRLNRLTVLPEFVLFQSEVETFSSAHPDLSKKVNELFVQRLINPTTLKNKLFSYGCTENWIALNGPTLVQLAANWVYEYLLQLTSGVPPTNQQVLQMMRTEPQTDDEARQGVVYEREARLETFVASLDQ
jgi:hypothetical protein